MQSISPKLDEIEDLAGKAEEIELIIKMETTWKNIIVVRECGKLHIREGKSKVKNDKIIYDSQIFKKYSNPRKQIITLKFQI